MKRKLMAVAGVVALAAVGGGAAFAAGALGDPQETSKAVVEDAAEQLGVEPAQLSEALEEALKNRVDEAGAAGRLTEEQGAELKERIDAQEYPLLGGPGFGHRGGHGFHALDAAAELLGLTEAELRERLEAGDTLAEVARAEGKTVDALVAALVADKEERLAEAVEAGRITQAQADEKLEGAEERIRELVNGEWRGRGHAFRGGPPPAERDSGSSGSNAAYAGQPI